MNAEAIARGIFAEVRRYLEPELAKRDAAIAALRKQLEAEPDLDDIATRAAALIPKPKDGRDGEKGADGARGADGKSVAPADLEPIVVALVAKAVAEIPKPRDGTNGRDGRDGTSVPIETVTTLVNAEVARAVAALPKPADGKDGKDGAPGKDGRDGFDGVKGDRGADGLNGKDGKDGAPGRDGMNGRDGKDGVNGKDGAPGKDGETPTVERMDVVDLIKADKEMVALLRGERGERGPEGQRGEAGASVTQEQLREVVEMRFAAWALDFEHRAQQHQRDALALVPLPRDGTDGRDGRDGAGVDDIDIDADLINDRTVVITLRSGERTVRRQFTLPIPLDAGVWKQGAFVRGDVVSFGGQAYVAQRATSAKPGESSDWRLMVRRGKDGKDAA